MGHKWIKPNIAHLHNLVLIKFLVVFASFSIITSLATITTLHLQPPSSAATTLLLPRARLLLVNEREEEKMRLIVHNMLTCNIKGVVNKFPLRIEAEKVINKEVDFNPDFLRHMLSKIEWKALVNGARSMGYTELPDHTPDTTDESFLRKFHHALLELHLEEGSLVCPETGRKFSVNKGIPNMLLHEDEV